MPTATCTLLSPNTLSKEVSSSASVTFTTVGGSPATGAALTRYNAGASELAFSYAVSAERVEPFDTRCYVGGLPADQQDTRGCIQGSTSNTTTSVFTVGSTTYTASCTNDGARTLQSFSTKAQQLMYECTAAPAEAVTYPVGCPYTTYEPYYKYYGQFDYADRITLAALDGKATSGLARGSMSFVGVDSEPRIEVVLKSTAYMSAWMFALYGFENAIDKCAAAKPQKGGAPYEAVHSWDGGVSLYVGSLLQPSDLDGAELRILSTKGKMPYTLANKRCVGFGTCGPSGGDDKGQAKANFEIFDLFRRGQAQLAVGECAELVPLKNRIASRMTVPILQGMIRYAYKMSALDGDDEDKAEGAVFAAAVLPQLHQCDPSVAKLVYDELNINSDDEVDFNALKAAVEGCYPSMDISCADVGGIRNFAEEKTELQSLGDATKVTPSYMRVKGKNGELQDASPCTDPTPATYTQLLAYTPLTMVTDSARIDLDQQSLEEAIEDSTDWSAGKELYKNGAHSMPTATCTLLSPNTLSKEVSSSASVTFTTVGGSPATGAALTRYNAGASELAFSYAVSAERVEPFDTRCYVGGLPADQQDTRGCIQGSTSNTTTSVFTVGSTTYTASCTNDGARTLQSFSTKAQQLMYECTAAPAEAVTYPVGCPYTTYEPYYKYYGQFDYADRITLAALDGKATSGLARGSMSFVGVDSEPRIEVVLKSTAYMSAWMFALYGFENAIDKCAAAKPQKGGAPYEAVHSWDGGVSLYVGSLLQPSDLDGAELRILSTKGKMPYTLANKRCVGFGTCGPSGGDDKGQAKANFEIFDLFRRGQAQLAVGECAELVPLKNRIASRMTVPILQGMIRYAYKMSALDGDDEDKAEGAVFAAAVLPQLHQCDPSVAKLVYDELNINSDDEVDFNALKAAVEGCYPSMDISCADVGGILNFNEEKQELQSMSGAATLPTSNYMRLKDKNGVVQDASPCMDAPSANAAEEKFPAWGIAVLSVFGVLVVGLTGLVIVLILNERKGYPMFKSMAFGNVPQTSGQTPYTSPSRATSGETPYTSPSKPSTSEKRAVGGEI